VAGVECLRYHDHSVVVQELYRGAVNDHARQVVDRQVSRCVSISIAPMPLRLLRSLALRDMPLLRSGTSARITLCESVLLQKLWRSQPRV
jgi:hypothetical protein